MLVEFFFGWGKVCKEGILDKFLWVFCEVIYVLLLGV